MFQLRSSNLAARERTLPRQHSPIRRTTSWAAFAICLIIIGFSPLSGHTEEPAANLDLSSYAGKIVWLDFWASWCVPCRRSFPWLNQMLAEYGDQGFVVVGVNLDKDPQLAREFLADTPAQFPIVYDPNGELATRFGVIGMPSSFLVGRDGQVITEHVGFKRNLVGDYEVLLREALDE
jgi:cytochrome c biogenesis protein CcmG/thiol:disulfide interchange protein DsbE